MELKGNTYRERCENQVVEWAKGNPIHNNVDDECCPDFSCCKPDLLQPEFVRTTFLRASREQRESMCFSFLASGLAEFGENVTIVNGKDEISTELN